jgi:hypothetical protein
MTKIPGPGISVVLGLLCDFYGNLNLQLGLISLTCKIIFDVFVQCKNWDSVNQSRWFSHFMYGHSEAQRA